MNENSKQISELKVVADDVRKGKFDESKYAKTIEVTDKTINN